MQISTQLQYKMASISDFKMFSVIKIWNDFTLYFVFNMRTAFA